MMKPIIIWLLLLFVIITTFHYAGVDALLVVNRIENDIGTSENIDTPASHMNNYNQEAGIMVQKEQDYEDNQNTKYLHLHSTLRRRLGPIDDQCERIIDTTLENIFEQQDCSCEQSSLPVLPTIGINCMRDTMVCLNIPTTNITDVLCGTPSIEITLDVWNLVVGGLPIEVEICFHNLSSFDFTVPDILNPLCIGAFVRTPGSIPLQILFDILFGRTIRTSQKSTPIKYSAKNVVKNSKCQVQLGDDFCQSCNICTPQNGGSSGGIALDCSNIIPNFVTNQCMTLPSFL